MQARYSIPLCPFCGRLRFQFSILMKQMAAVEANKPSMAPGVCRRDC